MSNNMSNNTTVAAKSKADRRQYYNNRNRTIAQEYNENKRRLEEDTLSPETRASLEEKVRPIDEKKAKKAAYQREQRAKLSPTSRAASLEQRRAVRHQKEKERREQQAAMAKSSQLDGGHNDGSIAAITVDGGDGLIVNGEEASLATDGGLNDGSVAKATADDWSGMSLRDRVVKACGNDLGKQINYLVALEDQLGEELEFDKAAEARELCEKKRNLLEYRKRHPPKNIKPAAISRSGPRARKRSRSPLRGNLDDSQLKRRALSPQPDRNQVNAHRSKVRCRKRLSSRRSFGAVSESMAMAGLTAHREADTVHDTQMQNLSLLIEKQIQTAQDAEVTRRQTNKQNARLLGCFRSSLMKSNQKRRGDTERLVQSTVKKPHGYEYEETRQNRSMVEPGQLQFDESDDEPSDFDDESGVSNGESNNSHGESNNTHGESGDLDSASLGSLAVLDNLAGEDNEYLFDDDDCVQSKFDMGDGSPLDSVLDSGVQSTKFDMDDESPFDNSVEAMDDGNSDDRGPARYETPRQTSGGVGHGTPFVCRLSPIQEPSSAQRLDLNENTMSPSLDLSHEPGLEPSTAQRDLMNESILSTPGLMSKPSPAEGPSRRTRFQLKKGRVESSEAGKQPKTAKKLPKSAMKQPTSAMKATKTPRRAEEAAMEQPVSTLKCAAETPASAMKATKTPRRAEEAAMEQPVSTAAETPASAMKPPKTPQERREGARFRAASKKKQDDPSFMQDCNFAGTSPCPKFLAH